MNGTAFFTSAVEFKTMQSHGKGWMIAASFVRSKAWYERKSMKPSNTQQASVCRSFPTGTMLGALGPWLPLKKGFRISTPPRIFGNPIPKYCVEELADTLSEIFGVEIKNCYNVYMNMKRRKDDSRTYFLDELREKLNKRMVESDLKGGKFKKR